MYNSVLQNKFTLLSTFGIILLLVVSIQVYAEGDKVEWGTSIEEAQSQASESGKPIMMDFYTDWWGFCKRLDAETFTDAKVIALTEKFIPVKVNPENDDQPINRKTGNKYGVTGYPAILFVSPDGGLIKHHKGFAPPKQFLPVMEEAIKLEADFQEKLAKYQNMPDDLPLNREMAKLYLQRYQIEKAEPILEKMPDDVDLNRDFAIYFLSQNEFDKAILIKEKMSDDIKLNFEFVKAYLSKGQIGEALIISDSILALDPKNKSGILPDMHFEIALTHARMIQRSSEELRQGYFDTAVAHFQMVIDKYPDSIRNEISQLYLGVTYSLVGKYDTSIEVLEKLINHTSDENIKIQAETNLNRVKQSAADAAGNDN